MSIVRTEVQIDVVGATQAERELKAVAAAEQQVATQATIAGASLTRVQDSQLRVAGGARLVAAGHLEAAKATGALASGLEVAGRGFTILSRAAAILPGFGIAGLLLAIGSGVKAMVDAFDRAEPTTRLQTAALAEYTRVLAAAEKGVNDLAAAQAAAGRGMVGGAYGVDPGSLSGGARVEGARIGVDEAALKKQQARLDAEASQIAAAERRLSERVEAAAAMGKVTPLRAATIRGQLIIEAENIGARRRMYDAEAKKTQAAAIDLAAKLQAMRNASTGGPRAGGRRAAASPEERAFAGASVVPGFGDMQADTEYAERKAREDRFRRVEEMDAAEEYRRKMAAGPMLGPERETIAPLASAMAQMGDSFTGTFDRMAQGALDASGIMVQAVGTITTALGSMMTNFIIAGDAGAKGIKKMAGNALAGVSAQAFGFAVLLEAMAAAAALSGPILGWGAPGLAAAGGIMAGAGVALGVSARLLGADKIGAKPSKASGGSAPASAAGTNPFGGTGNQQTQVVVYIGSEVVTRGVQTETRRTALRGGITEGRMAMAS